MTSTVADKKSRLTIRGVKSGHRYLVSAQGRGWFVLPERAARVPTNGLSAAAFAELWRRRAALDAKSAAEIAENIQAIRRASRG
jgi:hypothetical protein